MPLYEYRCHNCGHVFEMLRRLKEADSDLECPKCGSAEIERQFSTFAAGGCGGSGPRGFT
jgi:putative FmdB family regulatory protein